jgi:hypothetical protein
MRVARCDSFIGEGLGFSDVSWGDTVETKYLRGSGRESVTPYIHGRMGVILQCVVQVLAWLLVALGSA